MRTADPTVAYGGTWTFELAPEGDDVTKLTVVEEAEVRGRFQRFFVRTVVGEDS